MIFGLSISAVGVVVTFVGICFTLSAITPFFKKLLFGRDTMEKMFAEKWRGRRKIVATLGIAFVVIGTAGQVIGTVAQLISAILKK
jgi:hypothetical protein